MNIFGKRHETLVRIHADNANSKDWLVLLEAATVIGPQREKLRVALTTKERKVRKKSKLFGKAGYFVSLDHYDPRIHALYFCPQLYKNEDGKLVPLSGEEIGQLMANALEGGAIEKAPWYEPSDSLPNEPVIQAGPKMEFDSLVVDTPVPKPGKATLRAVTATDKDKTVKEKSTTT